MYHAFTYVSKFFLDLIFRNTANETLHISRKRIITNRLSDHQWSGRIIPFEFQRKWSGLVMIVICATKALILILKRSDIRTGCIKLFKRIKSFKRPLCFENWLSQSGPVTKISMEFSKIFSKRRNYKRLKTKLPTKNALAA